MTNRGRGLRQEYQMILLSYVTFLVHCQGLTPSPFHWILLLLLQANIQDKETKSQHGENVRMRKAV